MDYRNANRCVNKRDNKHSEKEGVNEWHGTYVFGANIARADHMLHLSGHKQILELVGQGCGA